MGNLERTPAELAEMWTSWHDNVGAPMKDQYVRMVGIANDGARELGFADTGALWRSNIVTSWPIVVRYQAAESPAGPAPIIAAFLPVAGAFSGR